MTSNEADHIRKLTEEAFWSAIHRRRKDNPHEVTAEQLDMGEFITSLTDHLADTDNPHAVTAEQVGVPGALLEHLADTNNPHKVTAEQVGVSIHRYNPIWHAADISTITGVAPEGPPLWIGGVLAPNGKIYGIPYYAGVVLVIDPVNKTVDFIPTPGISNPYTDYTIKWYGGVLAPNGKIYCMPYNSTSVLIIDTVAGTAEMDTSTELTGDAKWAGAVLAPNGKIYGIPHSSESVLIIDPVTGTIDATSITVPVGVAGSEKWCGGVLAPNGKIYGIPNKSPNVLIIDPAMETGEAGIITITGLTGCDATGERGRWCGGVLAPNGKIYGIPMCATSVLIIDPMTETTDTTSITVPSGVEKWCGGILAPDGKIYGIVGGSNTTSMLIIDPAAAVTEAADWTTIYVRPLGYTSWAGGVLAPDGKIYGIPYFARSVMIITPGFPTLPIEPLLSPYLNKF